MNERWEYRVETLNLSGGEYARSSTLNSLGKEGWELVSVVYSPSNGAQGFLKRRIKNP